MTAPDLCPQLSPGNQSPPIDDYLWRQIDFRMRHLAIKFQLPDDRREEFGQEIVLELLRAMQRFDPDTASWRTYACAVLNLAVKKLAQGERRRRKREAVNVTLVTSDPEHAHTSFADAAARGRDDLAQRELQLDIEAVLTRMPRRLRWACRLLMYLSPAETAAAMGMHRNSIYRLTAQARGYFEKSGLVFF